MAHVWRHHLSTQELGQRLGLESIDMEIARRQLALGGARQPHGLRDAPTASHAFVVGATSAGAPTMTYGRSIFKAMDKLQVDTARWHELAANRGAWRELRTGLAPPAFRPQARPSSPARGTAHLTHEASAQLRTGYCCGH